jgi:hypothetical protein
MNGAAVRIRLAGGVGDHLLGMRALSVAHERMPDRRIIVCSDCANDAVPLKVAALSPFASEIISARSCECESEAELEFDSCIDASGDDLFTSTAIALHMPIFEFLAIRPTLTLPDWAIAEAERFLQRLKVSSFIGVCFAMDEPDVLKQFHARIVEAIEMALSLGSPETIALNFVTSTQPTQFANPRIVPYADLPIEVVAALLTRCGAFIGADNGIKHLAWALDVPRTFFVKERPKLLDALRRMPDVHRMLTFDCPDDRLRGAIQNMSKP